MSFYEIVRTALRLSRSRGLIATARFLDEMGVSPEDRRKLLARLGQYNSERGTVVTGPNENASDRDFAQGDFRAEKAAAYGVDLDVVATPFRG